MSKAATKALGHYYSTACYHGHHHLCRLKCKYCYSPCRCGCHKERP